MCNHYVVGIKVVNIIISIDIQRLRRNFRSGKLYYQNNNYLEK